MNFDSLRTDRVRYVKSAALGSQRPGAQMTLWFRSNFEQPPSNIQRSSFLPNLHLLLYKMGSL